MPWRLGAGVIWNGIPFETLVIPAKAGIEPVDSAFPKLWGVDSRFRGNEYPWERRRVANDTSTGDQQAIKRRFPLRQYFC